LLAIPDFIQPDRSGFLIKILAVIPEHRQHGVGSWLVANRHRAGKRAGFRQGVH
jgi:GNAT superfamily N-acetyltransferase